MMIGHMEMVIYLFKYVIINNIKTLNYILQFKNKKK